MRPERQSGIPPSPAQLPRTIKNPRPVSDFQINANGVSNGAHADIVYPSALMVLCHLYDRHVLDLAEWSMAELVEWGTRMQSELLATSL